MMPILVLNHLPERSIKSSTLSLTNSLDQFRPSLPAGRARPAGPKITLRFLCLLVYIYVYIYLCIRTYHVRNNYVTYIVAMRPYFCSASARLLCVATVSSLPQLRVRDGY